MTIYYKAKHILLEEEEDTEYILEQLAAGISFEKLALEFSECDSAKDGGDLGRFCAGTMVAEFERALYKMEVGEVKARVKTKFGYHLILRLE